MTLKNNDLRDTILPKISIDEYQPKSGIDDEIIVVAFFAIDEGPGKDLDDFIEKGPYDIIDVDVSPNPDEDGNYLVFLEFKRQADFWSKFDGVVEDVENLTGELKWEVSSEALDYDCDKNDPELRSSVIINPVDNAEDAAEVPQAALESYLQESLLLTYDRNDSIIRLSTHNQSMTLELLAFGPTDMIIENQELTGSSLLDNPYEVRKLRLMLGDGWTVNKVHDKMVIDNKWTDSLLVTKYVK